MSGSPPAPTAPSAPTVPATGASATATVTSAPGPSAAPGGGSGFVPPYLIGAPGVGVAAATRTTAATTAKKKAPEPDMAATGTGESAREARARRRRRAGIRDRGHGNKYMDIEAGPQPDSTSQAPAVSDRGAGPLGFSGVRDKTDATTTGLTTLGDAGFGDGPTAPMLPSTWDPDAKD